MISDRSTVDHCKAGVRSLLSNKYIHMCKNVWHKDIIHTSDENILLFINCFIYFQYHTQERPWGLHGWSLFFFAVGVCCVVEDSVLKLKIHHVLTPSIPEWKSCIQKCNPRDGGWHSFSIIWQYLTQWYQNLFPLRFISKKWINKLEELNH